MIEYNERPPRADRLRLPYGKVPLIELGSPAFVTHLHDIVDLVGLIIILGARNAQIPRSSTHSE